MIAEVSWRPARLIAVAVFVAFLGTASGLGAVALQLKDRVLRANELAGFRTAELQRVDTIDDWKKIAPGAFINLEQRLRHEGFIAAVREDLKGESGDRGALSIVVRLRNGREATADIKQQLHDYATEGSRLSGHTYASFPVDSIPGAHGFVSTDPSGGTGINVIFADGAFTYHVGVGWGRGADKPPTKGVVIRAATRLYARVHGK